jgi:Flp pilus assembly protein TadD
VLAVVASLGVAAYLGSVKWRLRATVTATKTFLERGEYQRAVTSVRRALELGPRSAEACALAAEICEQSGSRDAIFWQKRAVELSTDRASEQCRLVKTALRFGDLTLAKETLRELTRTAPQGVEYHQVAGELAWVTDSKDEAEAQWTEAVRLAPGNQLYRLELAAVAILSSDAQRAKEARWELERWRADPQQKNPALRVLIQDARHLRVESPESAAPQSEATRHLVALVQELAKSPGIKFLDQMLVLDVLRELNHPDFPSYLAGLQRMATGRPEAVAKVISWMNCHDLTAEVLTWKAALPHRVATEPHVSFAVAETLIVRQEWRALDTHVAHAEWPQRQDFMHLILEHLLRAQYHPELADPEFSKAIDCAGNDAGRLGMLAEFSLQWGWRMESAKILSTIVKSGTGREEALLNLQRTCREKGDSEGLYQVAQAQCQLAPRDEKVKINLAFLALITRHEGADTGDGHALAKQVYQAAPTNPSAASTYAYSLHLQGRSDEGRRILEGLQPGDLESPRVAGFYALLLAAAGEKEKAGPYFARAGNNPMLLPEEKALFCRAGAPPIVAR